MNPQRDNIVVGNEQFFLGDTYTVKSYHLNNKPVTFTGIYDGFHWNGARNVLHFFLDGESPGSGYTVTVREDDILDVYKELHLPAVTEDVGDAKYDGGKPDIELIMIQFPLALMALPLAAMYGATKYSDNTGNSYKGVKDGRRRYASAGMRHKLAELAGESYAGDSHVHHAIHKAWNAVAELEFLLMDGTPPIDPDWADNYAEDWAKQAEAMKRK